MRSSIARSGERKRVFVADHFPISRLAMEEWLKATSDLSPCGEADNASNALTAIDHLKPDVVVTEIFRQQDLGFIQSVHQEHPRLPILVFSFRDESWYAPRALAAGANGYLMKGVGRDELLDGIRRTIAGREVLSGEMRSQMARTYRRRRRSSRERRGLRSHALGADRPT